LQEALTLVTTPPNSGKHLLQFAESHPPVLSWAPWHAYQRAIDCYLRVASIQVRAPDSLSLFKLYNRLGEVYKDSGDHRNGLVYLLGGQQINLVDGAEALRSRESINATRKLINNQVVGQVKHPDNQAERFGP